MLQPSRPAQATAAGTELASELRGVLPSLSRGHFLYCPNCDAFTVMWDKAPSGLLLPRQGTHKHRPSVSISDSLVSHQLIYLPATSRAGRHVRHDLTWAVLRGSETSSSPAMAAAIASRSAQQGDPMKTAEHLFETQNIAQIREVSASTLTPSPHPRPDTHLYP